MYFLTYILLLWFLRNDVHQTIFQCFFILCQSVLFPGIVEDTRIEVVALHASFEEANAHFVVWFLFEL